MNGQQVCVAIHHTERTYSPHRPGGRKLRANYQFSSLHQVLVGNQPFTSLKRRAGFVEIYYVKQKICQLSTNSPRHTPG